MWRWFCVSTTGAAGATIAAAATIATTGTTTVASLTTALAFAALDAARHLRHRLRLDRVSDQPAGQSRLRFWSAEMVPPGKHRPPPEIRVATTPGGQDVCRLLRHGDFPAGVHPLLPRRQRQWELRVWCTVVMRGWEHQRFTPKLHSRRRTVVTTAVPARAAVSTVACAAAYAAHGAACGNLLRVTRCVR